MQYRSAARARQTADTAVPAMARDVARRRLAASPSAGSPIICAWIIGRSLEVNAQIDQFGMGSGGARLLRLGVAPVASTRSEEEKVSADAGGRRCRSAGPGR